MFYSYYQNNVCSLRIEANDEKITKITYADYQQDKNSNALIEEMICQLDEYFNGKRKDFDIEYELEQLPFRKRLYQIVQSIDYGMQKTNRQVLTEIGLSKGVSVVNRALFDNPLIILIPCHRVKNTLRRVRSHNYSDELYKYLIKIESSDENDR